MSLNHGLISTSAQNKRSNSQQDLEDEPILIVNIVRYLNSIDFVNLSVSSLGSCETLEKFSNKNYEYDDYSTARDCMNRTLKLWKRINRKPKFFDKETKEILLSLINDTYNKIGVSIQTLHKM